MQGQGGGEVWGEMPCPQICEPFSSMEITRHFINDLYPGFFPGKRSINKRSFVRFVKLSKRKILHKEK
jgi:hypothetical protein